MQNPRMTARKWIFILKTVFWFLVFAFFTHPLWNKALQEGRKKICSWKYLFWPVFRVFPHEADICAEGWAALVQMCDLRRPDTAHKMWLIPFDSLWINIFSPAEPLWLVCSLSRGLGSSETKLQTWAVTCRQSSGKSLSFCRTFSASGWDVLWKILLGIWRLCDLWESGPYQQRIAILFGIKGGKDTRQEHSSLEHNLWADACSRDGCTVLCAAGGKAEGALGFPLFQGFCGALVWTFFCAKHSEDPQQVVVGGPCGNNCSDLKMIVMKMKD